MASTLAEKLAAQEKLTLAPTDAFPVLANPGGTPAPGMSRFNTLASMMAMGAIPLNAGSLAVSQPLALNQTWITAGVTYTALRLNVTDTASSSASLLMDLQVGGASKFSVDKVSRVNFGQANLFIWNRAASVFTFYIANVPSLDLQASLLALRSLQFIGWCPADDATGGTTDVRLYRDGVGVLAVRSTTIPQSLYVHNTWTNATNYERADFAWVTNVLHVGASALGTGTLRSTTIKGATVNLAFGATPTTAWTVNASGYLMAGTDNLYDIGANAATRPRTIFAASYLNAGVGVGVGTLGVGTTRMLVAAGTTALSQLRLTVSVAPTTPLDGDIWYDGAALKIQIGALTKTFTVT